MVMAIEFKYYRRLPAEIRLMIVHETFGYNDDTPTIEVKFRLQFAQYIRPWAARRPHGPRPPPREAHVLLSFNLQQGAFGGKPAFADAYSESYHEYHRLNPHELRFGARKLFLNFARDTVFMDALTLYSFHLWCKHDTASIRAHSSCFDQIRNLETTLHSNNIAGLTANPWMNDQNFLSGVTSTSTRPAADRPARCVDSRNIVSARLCAQRDALLVLWTSGRQQDVIMESFGGNGVNATTIGDVFPFFA
ncbi:hypothetical protein ONS96_013183 [Cadophora gregata f. sp. sojae]|nr:hypothetical protein ONS96_013183 [Cadophora gregata f. sp. sojae]